MPNRRVPVALVFLVAASATGEEPTPAPSAAMTGYVETFYQWSFNQPANGITNFRGFDNRHNAFTLANVVLDASGSAGPTTARVAVQFGHTPETYYLAEPSSPGTSGAASSSSSVWKFLQQANAGYRAAVGRGLLLEGGLFLSPIGPEGLAVKDQWSWSRSNLFFGLPLYHSGVRVSYPVTDRLTVMIMPNNGWNSVVDNNPEKSFALEALYVVADRLSAHLLYFGGVERPVGAPEGRAWRHLLDAYVTWLPRSWLSLNLHGDAGFEPNAFGTSSWAAGALAARVRALPWLFLGARGDVFQETVATDASGSAAAIFWPSPWVTSQTATVELKPHDRVSFRFEYRHDAAGAPMFFRGPVATDASGAFVVNAATQNTLTLGMTAWL